MTFTFAENIQLLASHGYDVAKITTPAYAARLASGVRRAGGVLPSKKSLRGYGTPPIYEVPRQGHTLEQFQMYAEDTPDGELTLNNLRTLLDKTPEPLGNYYILVVSGLVNVGSPLDVNRTTNQATYTYKISKPTVRDWTSRKKAYREKTLSDFFHSVPTGIEWAKIEMVAVAYARGMR